MFVSFLSDVRTQSKLKMQVAADFPDNEDIQAASMIKNIIQDEMQTAVNFPKNEDIQTASMIKLYKLCRNFKVEVGKKDTADILREKLLNKKKKIQNIIQDEMQTAVNFPDNEEIQAEEGKWLEKTTKRFDQDREAVKEIYKTLLTFLESYECRPWIKHEIDMRHGGNVSNEIAIKIEEIDKKECSIVVTGETSAGKSCFLNMLFGFDILPKSVMHCTNTICRIKNSTDKRLEVTDFDGNKKIQARNVSDEEFKKTIKTYLTFDAERPNQNVKYVDIYWPLPFLQANITIVDTPGVSDNSELTKRLFDFLPQGIAFIYILNTPNNGGVQTDRLGKLLKEQQDRNEKGNDSKFDSSTTMFICNKWDQIGAEESEDVYKSVVTRLGSNWPNFRKEQLYKLSVENVSKSHGEMYDFNRFKESFMNFLKSCLKQVLFVHLRWCRRLLDEIIHISNSDRHTSGMKQTSRRGFLKQQMLELELIKIEAFEIKKDIESRLEVIQVEWAKCLHRHLQDDKVKRKILCKVQEYYRFLGEENPGRMMQYIICRKIREELIFFCNIPGNDIQKCLDKFHMEVFVHFDGMQKKFDVINRKFDGMPDSKSDPLGWFIFQTFEFHMSKMGMQTYRRALKVSKALKIDLLITGIASLLEKTSEAVYFDDYKGTQKDFIFQSTLKIIDKLTEDGMKKVLKEFGFKAIKHSFAHAFYDIVLQQIMNERRYLSALGDDTKNVDLYDYAKVQSQCKQISKSIHQFFLQQVSEEIIPNDNVKLIEEMATGNISTIYKIEEKITSGVRLSAMKEIKADDPYGYLEIYEKLRKLDHSNVLNIYSFTVKDDNKDEENDIRACVIMELCETFLTSEWEKRMPCRKLKPKSTEFKASLMAFFQFSKQICEGLVFLHENGLAHKHLKLENILVAKKATTTIKIAFYEELQVANEASRDIIYVAPEIISRDMERIVFQADDVYSLGIIMWEMWYHERAFDSIASQTNIRNFLEEGGRPPFSSEISEEIKETIKTCWNQTPMKRPSCKETKAKLTDFLAQHIQRM